MNILIKFIGMKKNEDIKKHFRFINLHYNY